MSIQYIAFVTSNSGKYSTACDHLSPIGIELEHVRLDLDEIQSDSVATVALHKAQHAFRILRRPLIIEDSGFYIDELDCFPGPFVKYVIKSIGARGMARLADLTTTRRCHFEGVLVYLDAHGVPRTFTDAGDGGTVADQPTTDPQPGAWSALWDVFIPTGCTEPLSALREEERARIFDGWAKQSVFARFGEWMARKHSQHTAAVAGNGRLLSAQLNFEFPAERIAARPRPQGEDLLLTLDRSTKQIEHRRFTDLPDLLPDHSLVIVNNSQVVKAALRRVPDDGSYLHVLAPCETSLTAVTCLCPWKPSVGATIGINGGRFLVEAIPEPGRDVRRGRIVPHDPNITNLQTFMERFGDVPIPIYVNAQRDPDAADAIDYQNVYASTPGSVACPTAGLHFTEELLGALRERGHQVAEVTLHIGYGTWKSLGTEYVDQHAMDAEYCELPAETLNLLRAAKRDGRPVVAIGTSCVRTLESCAEEILANGPAQSLRCETTLFIAPPFSFRIVDHLVTNFAYPQTPIMALTAAFAGSTELLFNTYRAAIDHLDYLFFSYGDGMFIL